LLLTPARRAAATRASKRVKLDSSDDSPSDSDASVGSDEEFKMSPSESNASESNTEESNVSSDFNPFEDSDSDAGKDRFEIMPPQHIQRHFKFEGCC